MPSNNQTNYYTIWEEYVILENDFMKCIRYLPLVPNHKHVWSPHFADILLRICSVLDSFFKRAIFSRHLENYDGIEEYRNKYKKNDLAITDYRMIFENYYSLSSKEIFNHINSEKTIPYLAFSKAKSPQWWQAYNNLKHDRFEKEEQATLDVTLQALSGLFLFNVLHSDTLSILVDNKIIQCGNMARGSLKELLLTKKPTNDIVFAKSKLFGHVFETGEKKLTDESKMNILTHPYPEYFRYIQYEDI